MCSSIQSILEFQGIFPNIHLSLADDFLSMWPVFTKHTYALLNRKIATKLSFPWCLATIYSFLSVPGSITQYRI